MILVAVDTACHEHKPSKAPAFSQYGLDITGYQGIILPLIA
jgi:hypothetical protein